MITLRSASSGPAMLILPVRSPPVRSRDLRAAAMSRRYSGPRYRSRLGVPSLMLCFPLASGAPPTSPSPLHCAAFPRRSFLAPQSRRRRAPAARSFRVRVLVEVLFDGYYERGTGLGRDVPGGAEAEQFGGEVLVARISGVGVYELLAVPKDKKGRYRMRGLVVLHVVMSDQRNG